MTQLTRGIGICTTALLLALGSAAHAAELPAPPPFKPAIYEWAGPYAGVQAGGAFFDTEYLPIPGVDPLVDGDGLLAGGLVGYNFQSGNFVYGIEADIGIGSVNGSDNGHRFDMEKMATIRARAGFVAGNTLFYLTGGYAVADVKIESDAVTGFAGRDEQWMGGYTVGGGIEYGFGNLRLRGEYLYANFDEETWTFPFGTITAGLDEVHVVRGALIWSFASNGY